LPDLPAITAKRLVAALKKAGFYPVRQRGSHLQMKRGNLLVTVPMHRGDLDRLVLASILRQARMPAEELRRLL
jgi:predicted RNA binding protein YcfA (HicA-like mRNA interferase family)